MRAPNLQRLGSRLMLAVAGLALGLVLAELIARQLLSEGWEGLVADVPAVYAHCYAQRDAELGQVLSSGGACWVQTAEFRTWVRTSAPGVRGPPPDPHAPGLQVLAVGDSFTLGLQVDEEDLFTSRLSVALTGALARPVQVVNAGVESTGTEAQRRLAGRLVGPVGADAVLLVVFVGNDLVDNHQFRPFPRPPGDYAPLSERRWHWLMRWSVLGFRWEAREQARSMAADPRIHAVRREELVGFTREALESRMGPTRQALRDFAAWCRDAGIPCFAAVAPPVFAVDTRRAEPTFRLFQVPGTPWLEGPSQAVLQALPPDLPGFDLLPALRAEGGRTYFHYDGHWTARGHRVVAEALTPWLAERLREVPDGP